MKISRVSEMRDLDRAAAARFGIPDLLLMENAGLAVTTVISEAVGLAGKRFVIFCGMGNNGGDGFVIARKIHAGGGRVTVFIMGDRRKYTGSAKANLDIIDRIGLDIREAASVEAIRSDVRHCDAVVDALLGTGLMRDVQGLYRSVVELINLAAKPVVSVDIPSGVNGDTGEIMGAAVHADFTVTLGLPKIGNMVYPGFQCCGTLFVSHISFPPGLYADLKIQTNTHIHTPERDPACHKGDFGNLLCIAGAAGYYGAPAFCALSFLKAGGGYSRLAAPRSIIPVIAAMGSEIVFLPQAETDAGSIPLSSKNALMETAGAMDMVIIGPGLSLNGETQSLVRQLVEEIPVPVLIDGDGITAVCGHTDMLRNRRSPTILTPHTGEMARLLDTAAGDIENRKVDVLQDAAENFGAWIVLKGAHSLIGCPDRRVYLNLSGNSGMASAGSGDVLTGTIAAMHTAGLSVEDAVRKGVFVHGLAGDLAAAEKGEDGMTARDILEALPAAVKTDRDGGAKDPYAGPRVVG